MIKKQFIIILIKYIDKINIRIKDNTRKNGLVINYKA